MKDAELFAFDVHGVFITRILDDPEVLGGYRLLRRLRELGKKVAVIASGSNWSTREYTWRLNKLGFDFDMDEVWPAARIAALHLANIFGSARCLVLGEEGLRVELERHGHRVVRDWKEADAVVVGHDRAITFEGFTNAIRAVNSGAYFLAVNKVRWYYMPGEGPILSPGAIVAAVEFQTRREAVVVGKPSPIHFTTVLNHNNVKPEKAVMVGDDVEADMFPARSLGMRTILVTGVDRGDTQTYPRKLVDLEVTHVDDIVALLD